MAGSPVKRARREAAEAAIRQNAQERAAGVVTPDSFLYPEFPVKLTAAQIAELPQKTKAARFLQAFNASMGNLSMSLTMAGLDRAWWTAASAKDKAFKAALAEIKLQHADRAKYNLHRAIGTVPSDASKPRVADSVLLKTTQALDKEMFGDEGQGTLVVVIEGIARPQRRPAGDAQLPPDRQAEPVPRLPS